MMELVFRHGKMINWNQEKNHWLKEIRQVSFEDVLVAIDAGKILDYIEHPNKQKYAHQRIIVVSINHYCYLVPVVETKTEYFLKTIIPSRKATAKYLKGSKNEKNTK